MDARRRALTRCHRVHSLLRKASHHATVLRLRNQFQCAWADQDRALFELIHERRVCNHGCAIVVGQRWLNTKRMMRLREVQRAGDIPADGMYLVTRGV